MEPKRVDEIRKIIRKELTRLSYVDATKLAWKIYESEKPR